MTNIWNKWSDKLAGAWKCITYEMFSTDGEMKLIATPMGDDPLGYVLISPKGWLSAHIARRERMGPLPSGKPWQLGEDKEVAHVARGLSMYCGYLELFEDEEGLWWKTKVECCSDPKRMGGFEVRRLKYFEENGESFMILQPKQDLLLEVCHPSIYEQSRCNANFDERMARLLGPSSNGRNSSNL